jgi:lipoprotein-anchoring transpeptidase ErfK/SrfK
MKSLATRVIIGAAAVLLAAHSVTAQPSDKPKRGSPEPLPCGDVLSFQILLDRQGFSPGEIDGVAGSNLTRALTALQQARGINVTGQPDCDTWHALGGDGASGALVVSYTLAQDDVAGPFTERIPNELVKQASLPALGYRSALEEIAERFHSSPALLRRLNPHIAFTADATIQVPAVQPFDPHTKPVFDAAAEDVTNDVVRDEGVLRARHADGSVMFAAPVTTGSEHDPLPPGDWKVTAVSWRPQFHYNHDLVCYAKPGDSKATIKPGPNNPVGVVWIDISRDHYGLHGTPEPGHIGRTESHGCVRLTNWDAARLASLVKPGTMVRFR